MSTLARPSFRFTLAAAAAGIVVVAASNLAWRALADRKHGMPARRRWLAALGDSRLAGVRLAGLENAVRTGPRGTLAEQRAIAHSLEASARDHPKPRSLGDCGLLRLATGHYDAAVRLLERASRQAPSDTGLRTDLDAAYLARGRALERPRDLARALDRIGPEPAALQSAYNRALALQSLYLHRLAKASWTHYLERDPYSPWSRLAAQHLRTLVARERPVGPPKGTGDTPPPILSSRPEELQAWIEERGLGAWISAALGGSEADRREAEQRLRPVAARLAELSGDRFAPEEVELLAAAPADRLRPLAEGLRLYAAAKSWLDRYTFEKALRLFERASQRLRPAASPRFWWAEAEIAHCELQLERFDAARRKAEQALAVARHRGYATVEAQCTWVLAALGLAILDLDSAEKNAAAFYEINRRARYRTARASLLLGRVADEIGNSAAAWLHRLQGFRELARDGSDEQLAVATGNASFALAREGEFHAAADFASEALAFDRQQGTPLGLAESLWTRAMHRAKGGDAQGALADAREAESYLPAVDSAVNRARLLAGLRAVEGALQSESQPLMALDLLDDALGFLRQSGYQYGQVEILIDRARALRKLGRFKEALADLDQAAGIVAAQRRRIRQPVQRVTFFDLQAELADERVAASLRLDSRGEHAFWAADQARGLLFRDILALAPLRPVGAALPTARLAAQIGEAEGILSYWSLPDVLLIWVVRRDEPPRLVRQAISRAQLSLQISDFVAAIEERAGPTTLSSLARRLGEILIAPIAADLVGVHRLIVVPDRVVRAVPWPTLEAGPGEGPLLRRFLIRICPAAETLGADRGNVRRPEEPVPTRLLAIGDPEVSSPAGALSADLPGARREIEGIARRFASHVTLTGREATRGRLLAELGQASIVHIASHFSVGRNPGASRIVLAAEPGDETGSLDAEAIARLSLPRLRLAVLSGCATDREGEPSIEGTFAAAGSFLAAGASETVATLWPIDDRFTADLMNRFYLELLDGLETDDALRRAQLALLDGGDGAAREPRHWAAFQVVSLRLHGRGLDSARGKQ